MAFDITKKRASETAKIDLVNGDGTPLMDDEGKQLSVTVHGPGSKVWQQADAERNRRRTVRVEKNRGKISAAVDYTGGDDVDFLVSVTVSFNGWEYPGEFSSQREMFKAAYADDTIGYIRDHVAKEAGSWEAFTNGSATA